jgi:predicted lysophospholipase L1 biosynthesis ABC-type transport system permease subunit
MAVRAALGANRWRLVRQLLIENVVISMCGGIVGVGVGYAMLKWIQSLIPPSALPPAVDIGMDTFVLLFTLTVAVVTGLLFGVAPAARTTNPSLVSALKEGGHGDGWQRVAVCAAFSSLQKLRCIRAVGRFGATDAQFLQLLDIDPVRCDECPDGESADQSRTASILSN